jgi:hypothetical protein
MENAVRLSAMVAALDRVAQPVADEAFTLVTKHDPDLALSFLASLRTTIIAQAFEDAYQPEVLAALVEIITSEGGEVVPANKGRR